MSTRRSEPRAIFTKSRTRTRLWRLAAYGGTVLVTAVAAAASTQGAVTAAQASVTGSAKPGNVSASWHRVAGSHQMVGPHRLVGPHRMRTRPPHGLKAPVITGPVLNHSGPVLSAPRVYVDFWDWTSDPSGEQPYLTGFLSSVGGTSWLHTVSQYGGGWTGNLLAGTWSDPRSIPALPTDTQIQTEAVLAANHFGVVPSANALIVVATPTGHSTVGFGLPPPGFCAYHGFDALEPNITYINLPYTTDAGWHCGEDSVNGANGTLDGVSITAGHELAETITDPLLNAWYDAHGYEVGDKCAWTNLADISTPGGSFAVQPLWSNAANGCVLSTPVTSPYAPLIGVLASGNARVKIGGLSTPWTIEDTGVAQVVAATDGGNGPLIGVLTTSGEAFVKQGGLDAQWVEELTGVKQLALASDPGHGPLIGVLTTGGTALVKEGGLSNPWFPEGTGVSQIALASDAALGPLIGVLTTNGTAQVKEGVSVSTPWTTEYTGVKQLALAIDPHDGPLISVLTTSGTLYTKQGCLTTACQWVNEYSNVSQTALASDTIHGPLIGVLTTSGTALVKEGGLHNAWVNEHTGVSQIALGSDTFDGPLISVLTGRLLPSGTAYTKQGNLSAPWVNEFNGVSQITNAG
jgi:hypothetical protein